MHTKQVAAKQEWLNSINLFSTVNTLIYSQKDQQKAFPIIKVQNYI